VELLEHIIEANYQGHGHKQEHGPPSN